MDLIFIYLSSLVAAHLATVAATTFGLLAAALFAYFREEVDSGTKWALGPITRRLPWNKEIPIQGSSTKQEIDLTSRLTVVDVFLTSADGISAQYQKTCNYIVNTDGLNSYQEGVTAVGKASGFSSMLGTVAQTTIEHGFYISHIDLGDLYKKGSEFQNIYSADLYNCFTTGEEHWTQEIAFPTEHLTIRVHFPKGRPARLVKCKVVEGVTDKQVKTSAKATELFGEQCIVWEIQNPQLRDIYKLEWVW